MAPTSQYLILNTKHMASKRYPPEVIKNCKDLLVFEGWSPRKISDFYDGEPYWQTVQNWANEENEDGQTWYDERQEFIDTKIDSVSPKMLSQKLLKRMTEAAEDPNFSDGTADRIAKLMKNWRQLTDPSNQIPVIYEMLEDQIEFFKKYHKEVVSKEYLEAMREFKNYQRKKLTADS